MWNVVDDEGTKMTNNKSSLSPPFMSYSQSGDGSGVLHCACAVGFDGCKPYHLRTPFEFEIRMVRNVVERGGIICKSSRN